MILPPGNTITLPPANDALVVNRSAVPALALADLQALLPGWARAASSPVRDALLSALQAMAVFHWARLGQAIERLASARFADGAWLDFWGELLQRPRNALESDPDYRARLLVGLNIVSPNAITGSVRALTAGVTSVAPAFQEPATDAAFIGSLTSPWRAYVQSNVARLWATYPSNPNPTCGGYIIPASHPAEFWVILPATQSDPATTAFIMPSSSVTDYFEPSAFPATWSGFDRYFAVASPLATRVIMDVESRKAAGTRWRLAIDPLLANAK